jgi:hypothetical protein
VPRSDENLRETEVVIPDTFVHLPGAPEPTSSGSGKG